MNVMNATSAMNATAAALLATFATCAAFPAFAVGASQMQPVYRCGTEYTQQPCANGRQVEAEDVRSAAQRAAAYATSARDKRLGAEMERERQAQQAGVRPARAASLGAEPRVAAAVPASIADTRGRKKRHYRVMSDEDGDFIAVTPGNARKSRKTVQP